VHGALDMRRSFDGLSMMGGAHCTGHPLNGHLFVYCNKRTDRLKILYWDRDGWDDLDKRLEAGTFSIRFSESGARRSRLGTGRSCWEGLT